MFAALSASWQGVPQGGQEHAAEKRFHVIVDADSLEHFLGVRKFRYGLAEQQDQVGQVTGLAWTQVGGELLTIEAAVVPGKGRLTRPARWAR